jgi:hypothetical protein
MRYINTVTPFPFWKISPFNHVRKLFFYDINAQRDIQVFTAYLVSISESKVSREDENEQ